jgi:YVTN family beta-propeller protein
MTKAEAAVSFDLQVGARAAEAPRGSPLAGTARLVLKDPRTGAPLRGARPLAWMRVRPEGEPAPDEAACRARIKTYLGGLLAARADVDLNSFLLLTLNHDDTVSVIEPQISFNRTKLRNLVSLGGKAGDWALLPDGRALYVTQPTHGVVAVVDTLRFLVQRNVRVGKKPGRLALAPDGRTLWVDNEGDRTVSVLDTATQEVLGTLEVGEGPKDFAFGEGGRTAWLSSGGGEELVAVDVASRKELGRVKVGTGTGSLAYSERAQALYGVREREGEVLVVDGARRQVVHRISVAPGPGALRFEPSGRWAFVLYPHGDRVDILDAASNQVAHSLTGFSAPDQVTFTSAFAYVRNTGDARVSLIELASLGKPGPPPVIQITMGQKKPALAQELGHSPAIGVMPEGNSVIVAGTADRALYLYSEGMMAPRGTHLNYGREPRAVLVLDRSLREVEPGVYTSQVQLRENGTYDVHLLLDSPRAPACLEWTVSGVPEAASSVRKLPLTLKPGFDPSRPLLAGTRTSLRFRLTPSAHMKDQRPLAPEELQVLVFRPPSGHWLERPVPRRVEDGLFEVDISPPEPGQYMLLVGAESRGAALGTLPDFKLGVQASPSLAPVAEALP